MLFVDHDQAKVGQRGEDRQAGSEHDSRFAGQRCLPVAPPRRLTKFAVQADHASAGKACRDAALQLRCKVDFRYQQQ
ncbi:MAG: hypothetical protein AW12_03087 [Candidatus Accumulibacter sp. BA-94]|nr:MAG: hypothetical protein AW12_03087 [Candidatus Accumulibacter sp. BA-94]